MTHPKKLIEVALPLDAINKAAAKEKSIRHGHPSTLHLWWARRPLAAARAVIFSQMVDDPSAHPEQFPTPEAQERERQRLFRIIEDLVLWENTTNEEVLNAARAEIRRSCNAAPPDTTDWPTIWRYALEFDGYAAFGKNGVAELTDRKEAEYQRTGQWSGTLEELKGCLFYYQRSDRNQGGQPWPDPERQEQTWLELYRTIRRLCLDAGQEDLPAFHDPFAGGGSLPLEAQRLGLETHASDLNPVAVLINKAMIEIPPRFKDRPPISRQTATWSDEGPRSGPGAWASRSGWEFCGFDGAQGLAEDVRFYGKWMRDEAEQRIGHLYPKVTITREIATDRPDLKAYLGQSLTVIAWLWARTVKSPNPAFRDVDVPLISSYMLSTKPGKMAYVEPVVEGGGYRFTVKVGRPPDLETAKAGTKLSRGANFACVMSGTPIAPDYVKTEGRSGRMGARLMAIVAEGAGGRVYLPATPEHEDAARQALPVWRPEGDVPARLTGGTCVPYGLSHWGDLFTPRQLVALTTFCDIAEVVRERVKRDAQAAGLHVDGKSLAEGGTGAVAYSEAITVYLGLLVSRLVDLNNALCQWRSDPAKQHVGHLFARQAIPMVWDFAEANPLGNSAGGFDKTFLFVPKVFPFLCETANGASQQADAATQTVSLNKVVSTDPPYYDNIGYADLSDFFYVWLRRSLRWIFPDLFATVAVPKAEELVATPYRHGGKEKAESFFLGGMTQAMHRLAEQAHPDFPVTIYYAFKQAESDGADGTTNTGWDTFLAAVIEAGFALTGTWPMRTELGNRMIGSGTNALASSIVLVCRKRDVNAPTATRREFVTALNSELPVALKLLQRGNIAPVDLAQAAIGPGMAVYTRYAKVLDAAGQPVTVREALALINQTLDEALAEQEGDFDADTRWALAWFEQFGFDEGAYGTAETLSKAKNTSVGGMVAAGILASRSGEVRLLKPDELPEDWDPSHDARLTVWETVHHLIRVLEAGGEGAAAALVSQLGGHAEVARELAYRLYTVCERKRRAVEALAYNGLVQSWPEIVRLAQAGPTEQTQQMSLPDSE